MFILLVRLSVRKIHTTRHAAEFWMVEPEMAFANLQDVINVSEDMLKYVINYLLENASDEIDFLNQNVDQELRAVWKQLATPILPKLLIRKQSTSC